MREFCLTEEVIQQFVDGELSPEQTEDAAAHLASCDECASLLDEVEQESALLMEAFAPELNLLVPTASLRERLDAAIAELEPRPRAANESTGPRLRNWFSSLFGSFSFTPQQSFGFASLAVVLAFAAIFAVIQLRQGKDVPQQNVAVNNDARPEDRQSPAPVTNGVEQPPIASPSITAPTAAKVNPGARNSNARRAAVKQPGKAVDVAQPPAGMTPATTAPKLLPGEKGYLEAIASLTTAIETNKDDVLKPTVRADYERNLAVVDQAIATTRQQAKRNPNDRDAAEFMYMAYQNKIELLSAVADQTRMASR
jgi:anti-sigma factor RsiW